jgi:hypothetical protein
MDISSKPAMDVVVEVVAVVEVVESGLTECQDNDE